MKKMIMMLAAVALAACAQAVQVNWSITGIVDPNGNSDSSAFFTGMMGYEVLIFDVALGMDWVLEKYESTKNFYALEEGAVEYGNIIDGQASGIADISDLEAKMMLMFATADGNDFAWTGAIAVTSDGNGGYTLDFGDFKAATQAGGKYWDTAAIPEPTSGLLLLLGLAGLALKRKVA